MNIASCLAKRISVARRPYCYWAAALSLMGVLLATGAASALPCVPPHVTLNPLSQTVCAGQTVTFTAAASGTPTPTIQW